MRLKITMRRVLVLLGLGLLAFVPPARAQALINDVPGSATKHKNDDADEFITPSRHASERTAKAARSRSRVPSRNAVRGPRRAANDRRGGRPENRWRYQFYEGYWWYWTPERRWAFFNGRRWIDYDSELVKRWAGGGSYRSGGGGDVSGMLGGGWANQGLGGIGDLGTNAGALGGGGLPGEGTGPGRSAIPSYRGGTSQAAGGLSPVGAGGSLDSAVTGEGLGSSLFGSSGGMAAVPGVSGTRGSLGGASGVGINAGGSSGIGSR